MMRAASPVAPPAARQPRQRGLLRYERVIELIHQLIAAHGLEPGDLLPSIPDLARRANVSAISVRRALDELERAGYVERHQGVGTFVSRPRIVAEPARAGSLLVTLTGESGAGTLHTRLVSIARGMASPTIARVLAIGSDEAVWQVSRVRTIEGRPMIYEQAVLPTRLVPFLDEAALAAGGSLYELLAQSYGLVDDHEEQYLEVTAPTEMERTLLGLRSGDLVVRIRGVSFTVDDVPFDCFQQAYPAADFVFYVSGQTSRHVLQSADVRDWSVAPMVRGEPTVSDR